MNLEVLQDSLKMLEQQVKETKQAIGAVYSERQKTCTHPDEQSSPYSRWCDYCGWAKDRSF